MKKNIGSLLISVSALNLIWIHNSANIWNFLCLVGMVVYQPMSLSSVHTFVLYKFMCTCEDPAFIACKSSLWQAGYSLGWSHFDFSYLPGCMELKLQLHFVIFQLTFVLIGSTDYNVLVQCHSSLWSGIVSLTQIRLRKCFKTQQWN